MRLSTTRPAARSGLTGISETQVNKKSHYRKPIMRFLIFIGLIILLALELLVPS